MSCKQQKEQRRALREARLAHATAKSHVPFGDPIFRIRVKDERMCRQGIDANLPRPETTGRSTTVEDIKAEVSRLVATDPAFSPPEVFECPSGLNRSALGGLTHSTAAHFGS